MVDTIAAVRLEEKVANAPDQKRAISLKQSKHPARPSSESGC
jgi:hypothetical protein